MISFDPPPKGLMKGRHVDESHLSTLRTCPIDSLSSREMDTKTRLKRNIEQPESILDKWPTVYTEVLMEITKREK